jgi:hypothetical protein
LENKILRFALQSRFEAFSDGRLKGKNDALLRDKCPQNTDMTALKRSTVISEEGGWST